jgi:hypothetical protein
MQSVQEDRHGTYVVTYDVASRLQAFHPKTFTIPRPDDQLFERFHMSLYQRIQQTLPGITIDTIEMSELRRKIWEQVNERVVNLDDQAVLSTCQEIADSNPKSEGLLLNINRLFNTDGQLIGHGPRPGFEPLTRQFDDLAKKIAGRSVVLIEDGAFSGGTLRSVLHELNSRGLTVSAIVIGFCCTRAKFVLGHVFKGELVIVHPVENLLDWIPDHDLIPFIPNCGRVLGESSSDHSFQPVRRSDGFSCAYPYILPFGKIEEWASLPIEGAQELSRLCLDTSIEIYSRVCPKMAIGELLGANPRVSMPIEIGADGAQMSLDLEVVAFLEQVRRRLG